MWLTAVEIQAYYFATKVLLATASSMAAYYLCYHFNSFNTTTILSALVPKTLLKPADLKVLWRYHLTNVAVIPCLLVVLSQAVELLPVLLAHTFELGINQHSVTFTTVSGTGSAAWRQTNLGPIIASDSGVSGLQQFLAQYYENIALVGPGFIMTPAYNASDFEYETLVYNATSRCYGDARFYSDAVCSNVGVAVADTPADIHVVGDWQFGVANYGYNDSIETCYDQTPYYGKIQPPGPDWEKSFYPSPDYPYVWLRDQAGYMTLGNATLYWSMHQQNRKLQIVEGELPRLTDLFNQTIALDQCKVAMNLSVYSDKTLKFGANIGGSVSKLVGDQICVLNTFHYYQQNQQIVIINLSSTLLRIVTSGPRVSLPSAMASNQIYPPSAGIFAELEGVDSKEFNIGLLTNTVIQFYDGLQPEENGAYTRTCSLEKDDPCLDVLTMLRLNNSTNLTVPVLMTSYSVDTNVPVAALVTVIAPALVCLVLFLLQRRARHKVWFAQTRDAIANAVVEGGNDCDSDKMSAASYSIKYENDVAHVYILVDGRYLHLSEERVPELIPLTGKSYKGLPARKGRRSN